MADEWKFLYRARDGFTIRPRRGTAGEPKWCYHTSEMDCIEGFFQSIDLRLNTALIPIGAIETFSIITTPSNSITILRMCYDYRSSLFALYGERVDNFNLFVDEMTSLTRVAREQLGNCIEDDWKASEAYDGDDEGQT